MPGSGYASRKKAIGAAQEAMRESFGAEVRFEPMPPAAAFPRSFRVLDAEGRLLHGFCVFKTGSGIEEWTWQEMTPGHELA